ncbi:YEATS domain-containing protein 2-like [Asterias amurensis]|uniref:YEATS domain-containing protein 2-like n=1 Tax=Asterias amurensis TaxID=7602 RepID=UPI003AB2AA9E
MSTKRKAETESPRKDQDPDYEMVSVMTASKRQRIFEKDAKDVTVKKIEGIIKRQFSLEMRHKEKEVELIDERIHQARAMLDKLRACIVANYYGNIGISHTSTKQEKIRLNKSNLNHPAIQRAIRNKSPTPIEDPTTLISSSVDSSKPQGDVAIRDATSTPTSGLWSGLQSERSSPESEQLSRVDLSEIEERVEEGARAKGPRNSGPDTFGVGPPLPVPKPLISQAESSEGTRFHVKKRIIVGNVSKYIPPENREDSDPSTHKWMVYVRGPPEEPRIDHFVKRIWFFLHPSYRPNDLVEVKEPPFHLTRRGWGEFPIRIQLHFLDPRNKKVDIIHPLKLDRTYTGLQTLGAETIVDVELDRYLFDDQGQPLSRPMTPTITKVNYQEGIKPGSPAASWEESRWKNTPPRLKESRGGALVGEKPHAEQATSPMVVGKSLETVEDTTLLGDAQKDEGNLKVEPRTPLGEGLIPTEIGQSFSGIIGPSGLQPSLQAHPSSIVAGGQIAMQQRQGGQFVRVMPPLGPITKSGIITPSTLIGLQTKSQGSSGSPVKVVSPTDEKSVSIIGSSLSNRSSPTNVSPTLPGVINVAEAALGGKGSLDVRIQEGKVIQEVTTPALDLPPVKMEVATNVAGVMPPLQPPLAKTTTAPSGVQLVQSVPVSTTLQKHSQESGGSLPAAASFSGGIIVQPTSSQISKPVTSTVISTSGGVTTIKKTSPTGSVSAAPVKSVVEPPKHSPPTPTSGIPTPPPGTQYYITAKSTDPNLQGKVILIPQQVFQQASTQQIAAGGKLGGSKTSSPAGKVGASKTATPGKPPFLSPSNVLILPQGSIVPPLPPGSIVQIQQVPSPVRSTAASSQQKVHPTSALAKTVTAQVKNPGAAKVAGMPSGGVIQIQRTTGTSIAKVSGVPGTSQAAGISILPEQKGQLAKTSSGGVVFVQRAASTGKIGSGQTLARLPLVQGGMALQQKITLAAQLPPGAVPIPHGSLTLKPGSAVNIIQNPNTKSLHQGQTLVLHTQPSSISKLPGKPIQTVTAIRQPVGSGQAPKFIIQGQGAKVITPGQVQVKLSLSSPTSVAATRSVSGTAATQMGTVPVVQISGSSKVGQTDGLAVATAPETVTKPAETAMQELVRSESSVKPINPSSVTKEISESQIVSTVDGTQEVVLVKESSSQKTIIPDISSKEVDTPATNKAQTVYTVGHPVTKVAVPVLAPPLPRIFIKQEPITSPPKDFATSSTSQFIVNSASATVDAKVKTEVPEDVQEAETDVSIMMRELTLSCLEGPVSVYGLGAMEDLVSAVVRKTPLINKDRVQSEHPFTATSLQHYHSWTGAKRRAAEWHRAVSVRRIANEAREKSEKLRFERMWTTKEVMVWCRQQGYVPPEPDARETEGKWCRICGDLTEKGKVEVNVEEHECKKKWLSSAGLLKQTSYTVPDDLANSIRQRQSTIDASFSDSEAEIDIIGVWDRGQRVPVKKEAPGTPGRIRCYLPSSKGDKMIQEVAQEIGICFKPTQLAEDTFSPVVEEVMLSAVSQFMSSLLRKSLSKAYNKRTDNRLPKEILSTHVLQAINSTEQFDFLTNKHLGVAAMATENSQASSSSNH